MTATLGLFLSLIVLVVTRHGHGAGFIEAWGWRIPFFSQCCSSFRYGIRLKARGEPDLQKMKDEGKTSKAQRRNRLDAGNLKLVLIACLARW